MFESICIYINVSTVTSGQTLYSMYGGGIPEILHVGRLEAKGSGVKGYSQLYNEFEANLGHTRLAQKQTIMNLNKQIENNSIIYMHVYMYIHIHAINLIL